MLEASLASLSKLTHRNKTESIVGIVTGERSISLFRYDQLSKFAWEFLASPRVQCPNYNVDKGQISVGSTYSLFIDLLRPSFTYWMIL
jgi:hypothetical protein